LKNTDTTEGSTFPYFYKEKAITLLIGCHDPDKNAMTLTKMHTLQGRYKMLGHFLFRSLSKGPCFGRNPVIKL